MWKKKLPGGVTAGIILAVCLGFLPQPAMAAPVIANMPHRANGTKITTPQQTPKGMPQNVISTTRKPMPEAPLKTGAPAAVAVSSAEVVKPPKAEGKRPLAAAPPTPLAKPAAPVPVVPPKKTAVLPPAQPKPTKPMEWEKPKKNPPVAPSVKPKKTGSETPEVKSVYQVGDKGWKVKQAQKYLQSLGFNPQDTDGQFTKATRKALRKFQKKYNLKVTGNLDNATYTELKWQVESKEYGGNVESLKILKTAAKYRGVHYRWGGTTPKGFDCSGYVQYVFAQHGIKLSRTADTQALEGKRIAKKDLKPGDLVFFSTYEPGASHDGIYAGNGKFWNATSSKGIMLSDLNDGYWGPRYYTARRILRSNDRCR